MAGGFIIDDFMSILGLDEDGEGGRRNESPEPTFYFEFGAVVSSEEAFYSKIDDDFLMVSWWTHAEFMMNSWWIHDGSMM